MAVAQYEVVIRGQLGSALIRSFDVLEVQSWGPDATLLLGWFPDQAALHGLLAQVADLGLELISIRRIDESG